MNTWDYLLIFIASYLLGSISFAVIIARLHGINILKEGSGNAGATNIKRTLGTFWSDTVFLLDFGKGMLCVFIPYFIITSPIYRPETASIVCLVGALIGHSFSIFLKFKGGKGVATAMGGLCILIPLPFWIGLSTWIFVFIIFRYVSIASIAFGISLPIACHFFNYPPTLLYLAYIVMFIIITLHNKNIKRLIQGTESKFTKPLI